MPDADPQIRKTVSLPTSLWQAIEDWQFEQRVKRDAEAIRLLLRRGLGLVPRAQAPHDGPQRSQG